MVNPVFGVMSSTIIHICLMVEVEAEFGSIDLEPFYDLALSVSPQEEERMCLLMKFLMDQCAKSRVEIAQIVLIVIFYY